MDSHTWTLALNTLLLAGATCAICLPLGTLLAGLLVRTDLPGRRAGLVVLGLMLFVPLYVQTAAWQAAFAPQGCLTQALGLPVALQGWSGAIWVHAMAAVPWVVLIVGAGLRLVEPELEEQALLDGSSRQVFFRVTLRGALPAVGVAGLWVAVVTAGEMTVTDLFAVRTYARVLYTRFDVPQVGEGPLGVWPGVMLTAVLVLAGLWLCAKLSAGDRPISSRRRWVFRLRRWRVPAMILAAAALLLLIGVPLGSLCQKVGVVITLEEGAWQRSWSPGKCLAMVAASPWRHDREFGWSLLIGSLAATAAVVAAVSLAWPARRGGVRALPALVLATVCLALPGPVIGLGIVRLLNRPEVPGLVFLYDRSIAGPWLAMTVRAIPLATLVMWHAMRTIPKEMLESAAVDGAGPLRRLCLVALPCRLPALALAWVVGLAVALGDLAASILTLPPGVDTLSLKIFGLLHSGVEDRVAGICLAQLALLGAVTGVAIWLTGRWGRQSGKV